MWLPKYISLRSCLDNRIELPPQITGKREYKVLIALIAFWVIAIWIWVDDGAKTPLIFICLWITGLITFQMLGFGSYLFMAFQAILAAILLIIKKYNDAF